MIPTRYKTDCNLEAVGDYYFTTAGNLVIWLPATANMCLINLTKDEKPKWKMTGTKECPTLEPSLHVVGHWHGFLKNGQLISC